MRFIFCFLILSSYAAAQDLADGEGKQIFMSKCGQCHGLDYATSNRHTRGQWSGLITQMVDMGAVLTDEERTAIIDYLTKNFGKISVNTASAEEIQTFFRLSTKDAKAIVSYRSEHGPFQSLDELKKVPDIDWKILEEKKSSIAF
jgi:competence ComEA-like helix-hairpin-helix protein